jgi:hypothetical protein
MTTVGRIEPVHADLGLSQSVNRAFRVVGWSTPALPQRHDAASLRLVIVVSHVECAIALRFASTPERTIRCQGKALMQQPAVSHLRAVGGEVRGTYLLSETNV